MKIDIEKLRTAQARTGKTLAELNLPRTTLQNIRDGKNVRPKTVHKFAVILGVDVSELLERSDA